MEIHEIREAFQALNASLTAVQKKFVHFRSMQNFLYYYDHIPNDRAKEKIYLLFNEYLDEIAENSYIYKGVDSFSLASKYLDSISETYTHYLGFRSFLRIKYVIVFSILGDSLTYFFLRHQIGFFFPFVTIALFSYYMYIMAAYGRKRKIFGIFYLLVVLHKVL